MARPESRYVCDSCGAFHAKWSGRCDSCGEWNTLVEETAPKPVPKGLRNAGRTIELVGLRGATATPPRLVTGIEELDRVLGGGLVEGSAILIGGDPGIGKSTLALQAGAAVGGKAVWPVLGELLGFVDHGVACTSPAVRSPDDCSARDQECEVMKTWLLA
jgi:DNA repair protein RadA/Sms